MKSKNTFKPGENLLGGYHELDGTIEFYGRINAILKKSDSVLDLGAGRGSWSTSGGKGTARVYCRGCPRGTDVERCSVALTFPGACSSPEAAQMAEGDC